MKLVITDAATLTGDGITEDALDVFSKYADVTAYDLTTRDQLVERLQDTELVLCNKTVFTPSIFAQCPKLEYIGVCATGYNNIDTHSAITHNVTVCNAGVYATDAVAQHTFGLILHFYNQVAAYHEAVQNGAWKQSTTFSPILFPTQELTGKTLAVIGYGSIGRKVAAIAAAFDMKVLIVTRVKPCACPYTIVSMDEAFRLADVVTLHVPLNPETEHLVDAERLQTMKPHALLVNTARGGLIVEEDLAWALQNHVIAGAALDVLTEEPMGDTPLMGLPNCIITPHCAWTPLETRMRLIQIAVDNLRCYLDGEPRNVVAKPKPPRIFDPFFLDHM